MSKRHGMSSADAAWLHMDRPTNLMVVNARALVRRAARLGARCARSPRAARRALPALPPARRRAAAGLAARAGRTTPTSTSSCTSTASRCRARATAARSQELVGDLMAHAARPLQAAVARLRHRRLRRRLRVRSSRMHHCIADGIALARVMLSLTDADGRAGGFAAPDAANGGVARPQVAAARAPAAAATSPGALAARGLRDARAPAHSARSPPRPRGRAARWRKLLPRPSDAAHRAQGRAARRPARRLVDAGPAATVKGSRSRRRHGQRRAGRRGGRRAAALPARARRRVVDEVHAHGAVQPAPARPAAARDLGNRFGLVLLALPVGIEDPRERLREVQRADGRDQGLATRARRLRHPRPDGPHARSRRGAR